MEEIDPAAGRVRVRDLQSDNVWWEPYDQLLIATGALPICPDLPGSDAVEICGVNTLQSGLEIRQRLDAGGIKKAVVVGGGYIGLEMAEAMVRHGLEVSLVNRPQQVMGTLDYDMGALVSQALRDLGVSLYLEETLTAFETKDGKVAGVVTDKRTLPADIVVLGMGVHPNTSLAKAAGIALGEKGAIRVNERMETGSPGIWAAGDGVAGAAPTAPRWPRCPGAAAGAVPGMGIVPSRTPSLTTYIFRNRARGRSRIEPTASVPASLPPKKKPTMKRATMLAGIAHFRTAPSLPRGGNASRAGRSTASFQWALMPGTWPAPTTATIFCPGAWRIFAARYRSRSSIRIVFNWGMERPTSASRASSTSCCFMRSTSSAVMSSTSLMDTSNWERSLILLHQPSACQARDRVLRWPNP